MVDRILEEEFDFVLHCPIYLARKANLLNERKINCINCPVKICFEDINEDGIKRHKIFLKEVISTISELEIIKEYITKRIGSLPIRGK